MLKFTRNNMLAIDMSYNTVILMCCAKARIITELFSKTLY